MKINKSTKLISSLLIFFIIFTLILSLSMGCQEKEVSTETGKATVTDPDADAAFFSFFVALGITFLGEEIIDKKAKAKAAQESIKEELESVKAEYEAQYDFRKDFLDNLLYGPGGAQFIESEKQRSFLIQKIIEAGADIEDQNPENQNASETTVPQAQEDDKTTEEEKPTGTITLTGSIDAPFSLSPLELVIDLGTGAVTGSFTGVYEYEGFESEYYKDPPDTANGVADLSGTVELKTGTITGAGALEYTWQNAGSGETWPFAVEGTLSTDYKNAEGEFIFGEQGVWSWVATVQ
jgi:hypothetical protein